MTAVFLVFVGTGVFSIKQIGLGNAVGRWNWWLPKGLDRLLPRLDFERSAKPALDAR
jgi:uncharacterized membrane protein YdfJ with MMPL/SSD domain